MDDYVNVNSVPAGSRAHPPTTLISTSFGLKCYMSVISSSVIFRQPYRNNKSPFLEVFDQRNGVLFEVGQTALNGLGVVVRPSLLLGSFLQPLLQTVVSAGQEHHKVRSTDLAGEKRIY